MGIPTALKSEIKQVFAELTVNLQKARSPSVPLAPQRIEQRVKTLAGDCAQVRKELLLSKQNALAFLGGIRKRISQSAEDDKETLRGRMREIDLKCEDVQNELERLFVLTDSFETLWAKTEGITGKLLANYRKAMEGQTPAEQGEKLSSQLMAQQLRLTLRDEENKKLSSALEKHKTSLRERDAEIARLRHHVDDYVKLSEEQYNQIGVLKRWAAQAGELAKSAQVFLAAMDYLGFVITEDKPASEVEAAKSDMDRKRSDLQRLIETGPASAAIPSGSAIKDLCSRLHDALELIADLRRDMERLKEEAAQQFAVFADSCAESVRCFIRAGRGDPR